jgi:phage major head subunit gpT-like protein
MESAATSNYDATPGTVRTPWFLMDTTRPLKPVIFQKRQDYQFQAMTSPNDDHVFKRNEYLYGVDARVNVGFGVWQALYMSLNNLTDVNFEAALASMMSLRGDGVNSDVKSGKVLGQPLGLKPNLLVVGPSRRAEANKLIERERLDSGASNPNWKAVEVLITPYLP